MNAKLTILIVPLILLYGCSMLPYRDNFKCEKGKDSGVCNSVVEVYMLSDDMNVLREKSLKKESQQPSFNQLKNDPAQNLEEKTLREIANALSIKQIQEGKPIILKFNENSLGYDYESPNNQQILEYIIKDKGMQ